MSEGRRYFRVNPGPTMAVIEEAIETQRVFLVAMCALGKELGGKVWSFNNKLFSGIEFDGDLPSGWRKNKNYAVPNLKTKPGKALRDRFRELPTGVDGLFFSSMLHCALGGEYVESSDHMYRWTTFEKHGDIYILSVPIKCQVEPPNCDPLKMSEYWAIRESQTPSTDGAK